MNSQNRYCCRCHRTTKFVVQGNTFTCSQCGLVMEMRDRPKEEERCLIGNPFRSFKTSAA